ncbi:MAG: DLW-39 family protein [Propioniciclava sp.]
MRTLLVAAAATLVGWVVWRRWADQRDRDAEVWASVTDEV